MANKWTRVALFSAGVVATGLVNVSPAAAATPSLRVLDASVTEGNTAKSVCIKVQLSQVPRRLTTVDFNTVNGTATAPADFAAKSGTLSFRAGGTRTKSVCVSVKGDLLDEATERFGLRISNPFRATIADGLGSVSVLDNDTPPSVTVGDAHTFEGNAGASPMTYPVSLSAPSGRTVSVPYTIAPGSPPATAHGDYTVDSASGTLVFPAGVQTRNVDVQVLGDAVDELDERVDVTLSAPVNATIADGSGSGTIRDDDGPRITISDVAKNEGWQPGNPYTFTISLSAPSPQTVGVWYSTASGSASAWSDYAPTSGSLWFSPGQTSRTVTVSVPGDLAVESHENFFVNLSSPSNATIGDSQGVGTILNDDASSYDEGRGAASYLGSISGDTGSHLLNRTDSILVGDADWYRVNLTEDDSNPFYDKDMTARVSLNVWDGPAQSTGNLDMAIYRADGTFVGSTWNGGTGDEVFYVKKRDVGFSWDHTSFYVKVYGAGTVINNYTLSVNGNVATGIAPNL